MELMRALFCYALLLLPHVLGDSYANDNAISQDHLVNNTETLKRKHIIKKKLLQNLKVTPLNGASELQTVFTDPACRTCVPCMERSILAHKVHKHVISEKPSTDPINEEIFSKDQENNLAHRDKRSVGEILTSTEAAKPKKSKGKKKTVHKSVTVTKYSKDGETYALKMKATPKSNDGNDTLPVCEVYKVKKSFSCDSVEAEAIISITKRKSIKKRRDTVRTTATSTQVSTASKPPSAAASLTKMQVQDNTQVENFMPSIELY